MHKNPNKAIGRGVLENTRNVIANKERLSDYIEDQFLGYFGMFYEVQLCVVLF